MTVWQPLCDGDLMCFATHKEAQITLQIKEGIFEKKQDLCLMSISTLGFKLIDSDAKNHGTTNFCELAIKYLFTWIHSYDSIKLCVRL